MNLPLCKEKKKPIKPEDGGIYYSVYSILTGYKFILKIKSK